MNTRLTSPISHQTVYSQAKRHISYKQTYALSALLELTLSMYQGFTGEHNDKYVPARVFQDWHAVRRDLLIQLSQFSDSSSSSEGISSFFTHPKSGFISSAFSNDDRAFSSSL